MRLTALPPRLAVIDQRTAQPPAKRADPFYLSPEWRALVSRLMAERGRKCQDCGRTGCRIFGDHVHELRDGGAALDAAGIRLLCGACHGRKTAAERAKRMTRRY